MEAGSRIQRTAIWLVGCCASALLAFPPTPAKAASSVTLPDFVGDVIEGAAPGSGVRDVERFWISNGGVYNVVAQVGGHPREFKISNAGNLIWMGPLDSDPGGILPIAGILHNAELASLPAPVIERLFTVVPEFFLVKVEKVPGRSPSYRITGESPQGLVHLKIKATGAMIDFQTDLDRDGIGDAVELANGWDPESSDSDGDGFPDGVEFENGGDPISAAVQPQILSIEYDRESRVLVANIDTFEGASFYLEARVPASDRWVRVGEALLGDGSTQPFAIPLGDGGSPLGVLRAGFTSSEDGAAGGSPSDAPAGDDGASGDNCEVPRSMVGRELTVDDNRLCFKSPTRGEVLSGSGGNMVVTPFGYTFRRISKCTARLSVTFNTAAGIETTVYILTFGSDGSASGAFAASEYEDGAEGSSFAGEFNLSMR